MAKGFRPQGQCRKRCDRVVSLATVRSRVMRIGERAPLVQLTHACHTMQDSVPKDAMKHSFKWMRCSHRCHKCFGMGSTQQHGMV